MGSSRSTIHDSIAHPHFVDRRKKLSEVLIHKNVKASVTDFTVLILGSKLRRSSLR